LSISVSQSSADWIDKKLKEEIRYRNISHVFETLIKEKIAEEKINS